MLEKNKKRIGILRGGAHEEYFSSLKNGGKIISYISERLSHLYKPIDIFVDRNHIWHFGGIPVNPGDLAGKVDSVWNLSHPSLSNILRSLNISHVGVSSFSYGLEHNEDLLKEHIKKIDLSMPRKIVIPLYKEDIDGPKDKFCIRKAKEIFEKFSSPWIVKSFTEDTNMAVHLARTFPELVNAIEDGVKHGKSILIEEFIPGKVASLHTVTNFRNEPVYVFPVGNSFGVFSFEEKNKLSDLVKKLHSHISGCYYLKADFVLTPKGGVYLLKIDSTPDLSENSHFSQVCELVGAKMHHVVEHILKQV